MGAPTPSFAALPPATRAAINLLSLAAFFSGAALRICDGLLPRLAADFDITPGTAGRVVLTFSIAYGVAQLGFGPLGDRYGKARLVCAALFASAVGAAACALATAPCRLPTAASPFMSCLLSSASEKSGGLIEPSATSYKPAASPGRRCGRNGRGLRPPAPATGSASSARR